MATSDTNRAHAQTTEWLTVILIFACYGLWVAALFILPGVSVWLTIFVLAVLIAFHGSLTHEVLHGHPFPSRPDGGLEPVGASRARVVTVHSSPCLHSNLTLTAGVTTAAFGD